MPISITIGLNHSSWTVWSKTNLTFIRKNPRYLIDIQSQIGTDRILRTFLLICILILDSFGNRKSLIVLVVFRAVLTYVHSGRKWIKCVLFPHPALFLSFHLICFRIFFVNMSIIHKTFSPNLESVPNCSERDLFAWRPPWFWKKKTMAAQLWPLWPTRKQLTHN